MKKTMQLNQAERIAQDFIGLIEYACEHIEVAGSIRRKQETVNDIEIVCISKTREAQDLFGHSYEVGSTLEDALADYNLERIKNGKLYKQIIYGGFQIDLFITTPEKWGVIFTIRTGSADFSHRLVTKKKYGGLMPSNMKVKDGRLHRGKTLIETPTERSLFDAIRLNYIEPKLRDGKVASVERR